MFDLIAFDGDDTLWHHESLYIEAKQKLAGLLAGYADGETVERRLNETEMRNLEFYGYGIKGFTLSMIETAIELTGGRIVGIEIREIIGFAKEMLTTEVQMLKHAEATVRQLAASHDLMLITKGDLLDQQSKLARSGISDCFRYVEIVSDKSRETYETLLARHRLEPQRFLMVGNSLKSDILPVLALGGHAVYVPYDATWAHEHVDSHPMGHDRFYELEHLGQLPLLIEQLQRPAA